LFGRRFGSGHSSGFSTTWLSFLFCTGLVLFFIPFARPVCAFSPDVRIVSQSSSHITFVYNPQIKTEKVRLPDGRTFIRCNLFMGSVYSRGGEPEIPVRTLVVGVPPQGPVRVQVSAEVAEELSPVQLLPVPVWDTEQSPPVAVYKNRYNLPDENSFFPQKLYEAEEPAWFEDQRIVRIHLFPVQYRETGAVLRIWKTFSVTVHFQGKEAGSVGGGSSVQRKRDPALERLLLNARQAAGWRQHGSRPLQKQKAYWGSGPYYKLTITEEGIYRITGKFLKEQGISIGDIDPGTLKILNNGSRSLPRRLDAPRPDSLIENAILVADGGDGKFDPEDYILFYARSVNNWQYDARNARFSHYINPYTHEAVYWLTFNDGKPGKRMEKLQNLPEPTLTLDTFRDRRFIEDELNNLHHSGIVWFGPEFLQSGEKEYLLDFLAPLDPATVRLRAQFYSPSSQAMHQFSVQLEGQDVLNHSFYGTRLSQAEVTTQLSLPVGSQRLKILYSGTSATSVGYLDWIEVEVESRLQLGERPLIFFAPLLDGVVQFSVANATSEKNYFVFDATDFSNVKQIADVTLEGSTLRFSAQLEENRPHRFVVVREDQIRDVTNIVEDEKSDLRSVDHGADFLIITHNSFWGPAMELKNLRESHDGLATTVVDVQDVFDEFSAGMYDPVAIRDFLKYVYFNWKKRPEFVLLFGDGDFDYKNILSKNDSNWIPPFETEELGEIDNRTMDDWYTYVSGNDAIPDYCIGRIPVQTTEQAEYVVTKLAEYCTDGTPGPWKNLITIVADDEKVTGGKGNEVIHTTDAEDLAERYVPRRFDLRKIYLVEYPAVVDASASGIRKPQASEDLIRQINQGTLMLNFIGHGNPRLWTHERILVDSRDAGKINNEGRYAFWVAATCDFGRYDDPTYESFAEVLLRMDRRGAIGVLTSARLVFASSNAYFNKQFYRYLFGDPRHPLRVAQAMRLAKITSYNTKNDEKFHILGDPTLYLEVPELDVRVTRIDPDSLMALSKVTIEGEIADASGQPLPASGEVFVRVFDSRRPTTYETAAGTKIHYILPGNPLFRGVASVEAGRFSLQFIVPKDISYRGRLGRISLYFRSGDQEGAGYRDSLIVDGTVESFSDSRGPEILFLSHGQELAGYAVLRPNDELTVVLEDDRSGINITGDVGHKIIAIPNGNALRQKDLTDLFQYDKNSYLRGKLQFPLGLFSEFQEESAVGQRHSLTIKAWDNANNSSKRTLEFELVAAEALVIRNLLNYPNPFTDGTTFTFYLSDEAEVRIRIFTTAGRLVAELPPQAGVFGFNAVPWDGLDQDGDPLANGVYLYKITARQGEQVVEKIGKLIKMR